MLKDSNELKELRAHLGKGILIRGKGVSDSALGHAAEDVLIGDPFLPEGFKLLVKCIHDFSTERVSFAGELLRDAEESAILRVVAGVRLLLGFPQGGAELG